MQVHELMMIFSGYRDFHTVAHISMSMRLFLNKCLADKTLAKLLCFTVGC